MTLLLMETRYTDQTFAEQWLARRCREGPTRQPPRPVAGALFDHFPFLLYEYFATVPMSAARRVALAARAGGMTQFLRYQQRRGLYAPAQAERDCAWLQQFATRELRGVLPAAERFWQSLSTGYDQLSHTPTAGVLLAHTTTEAFAARAGRPELTGPVTESQTRLYAGLTLYQDCVGWKEDFLHGHPSQLVPRLLAELGHPSAAPDTERAALVADAARRFYYGGLAEHTLDVAAEHLCRALAAVTDLPRGGWVQQLVGLLADVRGLRADLDRLRRAGLAGARDAPGRGRQAARERVAPDALGIASAAAARYLGKEQDVAGRWGDFLLLGQQSTSWVTSYVGWNLSFVDASAAALDPAADWLLAHREPDGGWGYNGQWPMDVDSTANALLFLTQHGVLEPDQWRPALEWLLSTQRPDGGFATIVDPEPWLVRFHSDASDLRGWTSSHACVTAVVTLLLAGLDGARERGHALRSVRWLQEHQHPEGYWEAYWWMGRLYTTCRAVQAIGELSRRVELPDAVPSRARAAEWLLGSQHPDGGWAGAPNRSAGAFDTALAVQALCDLRMTPPGGDGAALGTALASGTRWLLNHQLPDGSWPVLPICQRPLRCPGGWPLDDQAGGHQKPRCVASGVP
ncbi:prenyltransferase/squalene oxidase repeat-containing protein, partial [Streptomyces sp. NPDC005784]|uniref:prenyltransferase/squalene oxidase repeat-containing protein n=1 Tax=Streptomyces sp. NPDC005784 TaxID=3364731 RepID=UPI0036B37FAB